MEDKAGAWTETRWFQNSRKTIGSNLIITIENYMDQQRNEVDYLPVFELRHNILQYFENEYPGFVEHLNSEIDFGDLKPNIVYDNRMRHISHPAEITPDRQFVLFEPYLFPLGWKTVFLFVFN